jgi:recombinational DNA repair protein (RecF pathway)
VHIDELVGSRWVDGVSINAKTAHEEALLQNLGAHLEFSICVGCGIWLEALSISAVGARLTKSISTGLAGTEAYYHDAWRLLLRSQIKDDAEVQLGLARILSLPRSPQ